MTKIPVGKTIAHAYRFTFGHAATLLRVLWLPLLAQSVVAFFILSGMASFLTAIQAKDPSARTFFGPVLLLIPIAVILFFVLFTAAMETATGEARAGWFHFPIGRKIWRLLGGFLAAALAIIAIALLAMLVVWLIGVGLDLLLKAAPGARPAVAVFVGLLVAVYGYGLFFFAVRFMFLLAPASLSGPTLGVARAWHLSAGNFWRAFLIILAIMIPISAINWAYEIAIAGFPPVSRAASKEAVQAAETAWRITELNAMVSHWYLTLPLMAILMLFQFGAGSAAQTFAYRARTEDEALVPVAAD
jgi:hypothetical protein